ncbi:MAG TPA: carboxypeptidase M32 [Acidobacteriota bacterium]|nr:carboxypeptidase M32 [Acidobacteriota bacterium]HNT17439.1 carboxypeptidase M32 [Acidobacteriota bacterium]HPA26205.1 carboxypeptidase M32 [Acidobacteriota bacterium]HQO18763.1 carboxypeptidase M32 [Acidobacteriota bacterium]HQQ46888.1 carboxypeptidase M32 [Acidobacteriota bacterium]
MNNRKENFYKAYREIHNLMEAQQVLEWDQQVMMPVKGNDQRAGSLSVLAKIAHEKMTSPSMEEVIREFESGADDDWDRANLREAKRFFDRQRKIPSALIAEKSRACAMAQSAWEKAKPASDFQAFLPSLDRVISITREIAALGNPEEPYDFLLDDYELGMTVRELDPLFESLKQRIREMVKKYSRTGSDADKVLGGTVPRDIQEKIGRFFLAEMGLDMEAGRLDVSAHPFTSGTMNDVRLTTRYREDFLPTSLFGVLHEGGHALYEQGLDPEHFRDPAGQACSLGIHESQSRFWENLIGRSRAFWGKYHPMILSETGGAFAGTTAEDFYRAVNSVRASFIRVEADEVTYNLHIILRYEIEKGLIRGEIRTADLPEIWNAKFSDLFGIEPPSHNLGVMQDVHWSVGLIGYFPTYSLGNLYSAQIARAMQKELGGLDELISAGRLTEVKNYMREKVHRHGKLFPPRDLIRMITGSPPSAEPFLEYLSCKYDPLFA